jgi:hypothetical protein
MIFTAMLMNRISALALSATTLVTLNLPTAASARPIDIQDGVTFNFQGCARSSDGNDVVCRGYFLSRKGEQTVVINRKYYSTGTFIANFRGKHYIASEIIIGEDWSCRNDCNGEQITFVEGVNYPASFVFRDVSLPSSRIALLNIYISSDHHKFRNIIVNTSRSSSLRSSDSEVDPVPAVSKIETPLEPTDTVTSNCPDRSKQFVAGETDSFNIYICGQNRPTQYVGIAKDNGSSIRSNLGSYSRGKYVAKNGTTAYTVTRKSLIITQNGRVLQTQPLQVSQWRDPK